MHKARHEGRERETCPRGQATPTARHCRRRYVSKVVRGHLARPSRRIDVTAAKTAPCGKPAHRLGDRAGRSPGSRVPATSSLPGFPVAVWMRLAAYSCGISHGFGRQNRPSVFPLSSPAHTGEPARQNLHRPGRTSQDAHTPEDSPINYSRAAAERHTDVACCHRSFASHDR